MKLFNKTSFTFSDLVWLISYLLALGGWFTLSVGVILLNLWTYVWMHILFSLIVILFIIYSVHLHHIKAYKLPLISLIIIKVSIICNIISASDSEDKPFYPLIFIGVLILMAVNLFWVFLLGSSPGTLAYYLSGQIDDHFYTGEVDTSVFGSYVEDDYSMTTGSESAISYNTDGTPKPTGLKCRALFDYNAASEDEVSFVKHEVMDILNSRGNWWKILKSDGTVGMAPSNYLTVVSTHSTITLPDVLSNSVHSNI